MKTISILESGVIEVLKNGTAPEKEFITRLVGKENLPAMSITDRIKTMDDVYAAQGITESDFFDSISEAELDDDEIAYKQAKMIATVLNEGTVMKMADTSQYKYYPWHLVNPDSSKPSGFGLSCDDCGRTYPVAGRGARLCFKTRELAIYAGKTFVEIYERLYA